MHHPMLIVSNLMEQTNIQEKIRILLRNYNSFLASGDLWLAPSADYFSKQFGPKPFDTLTVPERLFENINFEKSLQMTTKAWKIIKRTTGSRIKYLSLLNKQIREASPAPWRHSLGLAGFRPCIQDSVLKDYYRVKSMILYYFPLAGIQ